MSVLLMMSIGRVPIVYIPTTNVVDLGTGSAQPVISFLSNGTLSLQGSGSVVTPRWVTNDDPANYQLTAHIDSGSPTGVFDTWLPMTSSREFSLLRSSKGTSTAVITFKLRDAASLNERATGTVTLQATVE